MSFFEDQKKKSNQVFPGFEVQKPLIKIKNTELEIKNIEENKELKVKNYFQKVLSNSLIFIGVYLIYASSLTIFHVYIANLAHISNSFFVILIFAIGLILTFLGVKPTKEKKYLLSFFIVPLLSVIFGILFASMPSNWHGKLFGELSIFFFPIILFIFYYVKENFPHFNFEQNANLK